MGLGTHFHLKVHINSSLLYLAFFFFFSFQLTYLYAVWHHLIPFTISVLKQQDEKNENLFVKSKSRFHS